MENRHFWQSEVMNFGWLAGILVVLLALVGMVVSFSQRGFISGVMSEGQLLIFLTVALIGFVAGKKMERQSVLKVALWGGIIGFVAGLSLIVLVLLIGIKPLNLRSMFLNASPQLVKVLTFGKGQGAGFLYLLL